MERRLVPSQRGLHQRHCTGSWAGFDLIENIRRGIKSR